MNLQADTTAKELIPIIQAYRKKYLEIDTGQGDLFDSTNWYTKESYLTDSRIDKATRGDKPAGYFSSVFTNNLSFDLDDHYSGGWIDNETPTDVLRNKYRELSRKMDVPSVAIRSPHGIHSAFLLTQKLPSIVLVDCAKKRIGDIAEVRPTTNQGLRLPNLKNLIHPVTLKPIKDIELKYYNPIILFDDTFTRNYYKDNYKFNTSRLRLQTNRLLELEQKFQPTKGNTNNSICMLGLAYKRAGLTIDEAVCRFTILLNTTGYTGELKSISRLKDRLSSVYKNFKESLYEHRRDIELNLFDNELIENILNDCPYTPQRKIPLHKFLTGLLDWVNYLDGIYRDNNFRAYWNYIYPKFNENMNEGYYPLPSNLLLKSVNNKYYKNFLDYLQKVEFIKISLFKYSTSLGVCNHYKINKNYPKTIKW